MYNLAKSLITQAANYLSGILTASSDANLKEQNPEFTRDEISNYFSDPMWKSGYMNGYYYGYMPPDDNLAVQLEIISRVIHHRFINYSYEYSEILTPKHLPIDKRVILYKSDLELLDPRNIQGDKKYTNSSRYKWFCELIDSFNWDTKLQIPSLNTIRKIRITGDWSTYQDINLELNIDESGNSIPPTIREICAAVFPVIAHTWVCYREIEEYSISWKISPAEPNVLELVFEPGWYHIDNRRYAKGCYDDKHN